MVFTPEGTGFGPDTTKTPKDTQRVPPKAPIDEPVITKASFIPEIQIQLDKLPSKGTPYSKGSEIKYRAYSFGEIKKVNQENSSEKATFELILQGVDCSFDKTLLTLPDCMYIGLLRKLSTFGSEKARIRYKCGHCNSIENSEFEIKNIEFEDMAAPRLPVMADLSCGTLEFHPATVADYFELIKVGLHKDEVAYTAMQCKNKPFEETHKLLDGLNVDDGMVVNDVDQALYHGIKPISFKCSKCSKPNSVELDGGQALLLPFREHQAAPKTRIRFGN